MSDGQIRHSRDVIPSMNIINARAADRCLSRLRTLTARAILLVADLVLFCRIKSFKIESERFACYFCGEMFTRLAKIVQFGRFVYRSV